VAARARHTEVFILLLSAWALIGLAWLLTRGEQRQLTAAQRGAELFRQQFRVAQGLGPLFNRRSYDGCHGFPSAGGVGPNGLATELRLEQSQPAIYDRPIGLRELYRDPVSGAEHYLVRYPRELQAQHRRHSAAHTNIVLGA
jgi:hypothetical protein